MEYKLITSTNFEKVRAEINKNKSEKIVFTSDDDELNRKVLEKLKVDVLLLNMKDRKDFQKQRNSGLNHVMAKIAKANNFNIGINLDEIAEANKFDKAKILARVKQNVKICSKNKLDMLFVVRKKENSRELHDLKSLGLVLGMNTGMTKNLSIQSFFN